MMQSLAEVEPVVLDASFECALGLSVLEVEKSLPLPPVKSGVAERFKSAMSEGFIAPSEFRRMVLAVDSSGKTERAVEDVLHAPNQVVGDAPKPILGTTEVSPQPVLHVVEDSLETVERIAPSDPKLDSAIFRPVEGKPLQQNAFVVKDLPKSVVRTVEDLPEVPVRVVENLPGNSAMSEDFIVPSDFRRVDFTIDSSGKTERTVEDLPDTPNQVVGDAPKPISGTTEVSPQQVLHVVEDSLETVERIAPSDPKLDSAIFRPIDGKPLQQNASVVKDLPKSAVRTVEDSPEVSVRVVENLPDNKVHAVKTINHASLNVKETEQVQIIAPAPLPIELSAAPVRQQEIAPAVPSDATRMFVAVAEAVADAILVSSGFSNGEGSVIVRLRPEVLGGSEVRIIVKDGVLSVVLNAATEDVQEMVETNRAQFEQHLAEKVHSWRISVAVRRGGKSDERV